MRVTALLLLVGVLAGCGGADATPTTTTSGTAATTTTAETGTTTTTAGEVDEVDLPGVLGLPEITLLTPTSGGGTRPILEWEAVDGAAGYEVALSGPGGGIYWAGWATGTSIPVGGEPLIDPAYSGPSVSEGMTWSVAAYNADGYLLAVSAIRPIGP